MRKFSLPKAGSAGADEWERLSGEIIDSSYELGTFAGLNRNRAIFSVSSSVAEQFSCPGMFVLLERASDARASDRLRSYLEASFLRDVNLLRVFRAGEAELFGEVFLYLLVESGESTLEERQRDGSLRLEDVRDLTQQLAGALSYLHSEDFVYCALQPDSVWRVGDQWKLADYSQLRLNGQREENPARSFETAAVELPPEAQYEGVGGAAISPAWDVWALGSLLKHVMPAIAAVESGHETGVNGTARALEYPAPFDAIIRGSLTIDPAERLSLGEISYKLQQPIWTAPAEPALVASPSPHSDEPMVSEHEQATAPEAAFDDVEYHEEPLPRRRSVGKAFAIAIMLALLCGVALYGVKFGGFENLPFFSNAVEKAPSRPVAERPAAPAPEPPAADQKAPVESDASFGSGTARQVLLLLERWTESTRGRELTRQLACYAPTVDRYFELRSLNPQALRTEKEREFGALGNSARITLDHIEFKRATADWVVVSFDKNWTSAANRPSAGSVREEMILRRFQDEWKISSESKVKTNWTSRGDTRKRRSR